MRKKGITAAELMAQLEKNEDYQAMKKNKEEELEKIYKPVFESEKPLVKKLNDLGYAVKSVWDFVNTTESYERAIPLLIESLKEDYHLRIKAGIARSLIVYEAKDVAWDTLIDQFKKAKPKEEIKNKEERGYKSALALALSEFMDESRIDQILELVLDQSHGSGRWFLVDKLKSFKKIKKVKEALKILKKDKKIVVDMNKIDSE